MSEHLNNPALWKQVFPWPKPAGNKYDRGHAVVAGGHLYSTGAAKLAAQAALRVGAGLVSVACDSQTLPFYATHFQAVMTKHAPDAAAFHALVADDHVKAVLIGPGAGVGEPTQLRAINTLTLGKPTVLDADALSVFAGSPETLAQAIHDSKQQAPYCIITPHEGEFARVFGKVIDSNYDKITRAQKAAQLIQSIVLLKGNETIIAAPDGRYVINPRASPFLATAGSGDVLAGMCVGLQAQAMPVFEAACAAAWLHAEAASRFGPSLIAEDIAQQLPPLLAELYRTN